MADNFAYDLSLFENRERKTKAVRKELPKALPQSGFRTTVVLIGRLVIGVIVGLIVCSCIYSRVVLSETVDQISRAKDTLTKLQSEQTRLNMELDSKISIKSIEAYATGTLGLGRVDKYQVSYITLAGDDRIETMGASEKQKPLIPDINELFYAFVEYIN
ncbi:MAG: hypothetical protein ACERKO_04925 [Acetanaerobacterium sp.]